MEKDETVVISFRVERSLLERFDELLKKEGMYQRSIALRKLVISAIKRGKLNSAC